MEEGKSIDREGESLRIHVILFLSEVSEILFTEIV